jgi:hypothetical protein
MVLPGMTDSMETPEPSTVIVKEAVAVWPEESVTVITILCVPGSLVVGVQLKSPDELIFELVTLVPLKESLTEKVGLEKPDDTAAKETSWPVSTTLPGERDWMLRDVAELTVIVRFAEAL